jgi:hypothetical protein
MRRVGKGRWVAGCVKAQAQQRRAGPATCSTRRRHGMLGCSWWPQQQPRTCTWPRRPTMTTLRTRDRVRACSAWAAMSVAASSLGCFDKMRAQSSATLPWPITTTVSVASVSAVMWSDGRGPGAANSTWRHGVADGARVVNTQGDRCRGSREVSANKQATRSTLPGSLPNQGPTGDAPARTHVDDRCARLECTHWNARTGMHPAHIVARPRMHGTERSHPATHPPTNQPMSRSIVQHQTHLQTRGGRCTS